MWYIEDPYFYTGEVNAEPYQEIRSERFELFNRRLKEMGIPAKVVFKYLPSRSDVKKSREEKVDLLEDYKEDLDFAKNRMEQLLKKDREADIVSYQPLDYEAFLPLNEYLAKEENVKVKEALPKAIWNVNRVNGELYQIPKGNVSINETVYIFYKPFLEQYGIELNPEEIRQMNPKEVIEFLLPYFEANRLLEGRYYLTSASDLQYENFFLGRQLPVIPMYSDCNLSLQLTERKIESLLDTKEMQECLRVKQWIYDNDIDAHIEMKKGNYQARPVFQIMKIPTIEELTENFESEWVEVPLGNRMICHNIGNGVLKESKEKELAVRVLAASMYDKELSNLMIYGIKGKNYELKDGYVESEKEMFSSMGSFGQIGNNLITYPNQMEVKEKREITERILQEVQYIPYSDFVPKWKEKSWQSMMNIAKIYWEINSIVGMTEVADLDEYLEKQNQKLRDAGVQKVIEDLQQQVNDWKE